MYYCMFLFLLLKSKENKFITMFIVPNFSGANLSLYFQKLIDLSY